MAFEAFVEKMEVASQQQRMKEILDFIGSKYPELEQRIAWNQPHFVMDGTFIIGFSYAKAHIAIAPEHVTIEKFKDEALQSGYSVTNQIIRIQWEQAVNYDLIQKMIEFNMVEKAGYKTYWR